MKKPTNLNIGQLFFDVKFYEVYLFDKIEKGIDMEWYVFLRKPYKIGKKLYYEGSPLWLNETELEDLYPLPNCKL